jgi:hypothetical protein
MLTLWRVSLANKPMDDFDNDFGFTTVDTDEIMRYNEPINEARDRELEEANRRLEKMYSTILKLLENLSKNPEQELIKWPNRVEKISQFKLKLNRIRTGEE